MKPLLPGQAAIVRHEGEVCLVVCDESFVMVEASYQIKTAFQMVRVDEVVVPVMFVLMRLSHAEGHRYFTAWIDELEENVLESLTTQTEIPLLLASPLGQRLGKAKVGGLREAAFKSLGRISELASSAPWTPAHFAAARAYLESQHSETARLWRELAEQ